MAAARTYRSALIARVDIAEVINLPRPADLASCVLHLHPPHIDRLIDHLDCTLVGALLLRRAVPLGRDVLPIDHAIDPRLPAAAAETPNQVNGLTSMDQQMIR